MSEIRIVFRLTSRSCEGRETSLRYCLLLDNKSGRARVGRGKCSAERALMLNVRT